MMTQAETNDGLALLLAERACQRLAVLHSQYVDAGELEKLMALFAEDAVWEHAADRYQGLAEIRVFFQQITSAPGRVSRHVISNQQVDIVDAATAVGTMYLTLYRAVVGENDSANLEGQPVMVGEYEDVYVNTEAGWRFKSRRLKNAFLR